MKVFGKIILVIIISALLGGVGYSGYYLYNENEKSNKKVGDLENKISAMENEKKETKNEIKNETINEVNEEEHGYKANITTEDKLRVAYYLGDVEDTTKLKSEDIIELLCELHAYSASGLDLLRGSYYEEKEFNELFTFEDTDMDHYSDILCFEENDIKTVASKLFGFEIKTGTSINDNLKYRDGKYYYRYIGADGESLGIRNIEKNGNTYTFSAVSMIDGGDFLSDSEFEESSTKVQAVIENDVIKSVKKIR